MAIGSIPILLAMSTIIGATNAPYNAKA